MKKNVKRVISLILVAGMLFAFASCAQKVKVSFVDENGNPVDVNALMAGAPAANGNSAPIAPPADNNNPAPADPVTTPPAGGDATAPAGGDTTAAGADQGAASTGMPQTTQQIADFYKAAVKKVKIDRVAGYDKKEWQVIDAINIGGDAVNNAVTKLAGNFATTEDEVKVQDCPKGSDEAEHRFPQFILTDYSQIASAKCEPKGSNYKITIIMKDEDTPKESGCMLQQVTNSILFWEDIEKTLTEDKTVSKVISSYSDIHVIYKAFKIEAEITPDGKFVTLDHTADVDINIGAIKVLVFPLENKSGHLINYCQYRNFKY